MILNPIQSMGSLTGLLTKSHGKGHRLSCTQLADTWPFVWQMFSQMGDDTWGVGCSLTESGTGIWGNLFG